MRNILFSVVLLSFPVMAQHWQPVGPTTPPDAVEIACHPTNSNELYFATLQSGLYKSTNGGQSWQFEADFAGYYFRHIKYNKFNPDLFYAVTSGGVFQYDAITQKWTELTTGVNWSGFMSIAIPSISGDTVVVGTNQGTFRTFNGGTSWENISEGFYQIDNYVMSLECDPLSPQHIYAGTSESIYESTAFGSSWQRLNIFDESAYLTDILINPTNPNLMFITTKHDGIYKSLNGGNDWVYLGVLGSQIHAIRFKPNSQQTLYCASYSGVFKSNNSGASWSEILDVGSVGLAVSIQEPDHVYTATRNDGMHISYDAGESWSASSADLQGMTVTDIYISSIPGSYSYICGDGSVFRAEAHSDEWYDITPDPDYSYFRFLTGNPSTGTIYTGGSSLYQSTDNGSSWIKRNGGIPYMVLNDLTVHPRESSTLFLAGTNAFEGDHTGLYKSIDLGENWFHVSDPLISDMSVNALMFDTLNVDALYIGGSNIYSSEDYGESWSSCTDGLTEDVLVWEMGSAPEDSEFIYLCTNSGLFRANRYIPVWEHVGPDNVHVYSITFQNDTTFIATSDGVYMNVTGQEPWSEFSEGLWHRKVTTIRYNSDNYVLYAGTRGGGLYQYSFLDTTTQIIDPYPGRVPEKFMLSQNYPNPFNPTTTIQYELPHRSDVKITIYDLLGRKVTTLVNQTQEAGFKSVQWNATNDHDKPVSVGVYLYQIRAGLFVQTKKMVLLK